ncbi:MAG: multidrug effflux MFS transporter [Gammaproteobacteria bacterium]|nr:multidrug effflux MFS transporter [Gammaproteobacteria bacterium]
MLPALPDIAAELRFENPNDSHFIISMLFVGMSFGQIIFGPLSDFTGRKPAIICGILIFIGGSLISYFSNSMSDMMIGRFLQGLGAAGPRIVSVALVRDRYEGRMMARVMSFVMTVFILVPVFAPAVGQLVLNFGSWRAIFGMFIIMSFLTLLWFILRQPETLPAPQRKLFSAKQMLIDIRQIVAIPAAVGYTLTMGFLFGAFLGYLSSAQQIFQVQYGLGNLFAMYFGVLAASIGVAALINAKLVMRYGMRRLSFTAMFAVTVLSIPFLLLAQYYSGHPPFAIFMLYLLIVFFFFGILFGNLNALAMEPLGHVAGLGAALVGSVSTLISVALGALIAGAYDGSIMPLVIGIAVLSVASLISMRWTEEFSARLKAQ